MPLAEVQECLVKLARGDQHPLAAVHTLTSIEKDWLLQVQTSKGLQVTEQIQSWWRLGRLQVAAPFTVGLLIANNQQDIVIDYIQCQPVRTLFFAAEIEQFQGFLNNHESIDTFTRTTIAFECALKNANQLVTNINRRDYATDTRTSQYREPRLAPGVVALAFNRNPFGVFHALLEGKPLPTTKPENHYLIVAPHLPDLWRSASAAEFLLLTSGNNFFTLRHSGDATTRALIHRMIREGIIRP